LPGVGLGRLVPPPGAVQPLLRPGDLLLGLPESVLRQPESVPRPPESALGLLKLLPGAPEPVPSPLETAPALPRCTVLPVGPPVRGGTGRLRRGVPVRCRAGVLRRLLGLPPLLFEPGLGVGHPVPRGREVPPRPGVLPPGLREVPPLLPEPPPGPVGKVLGLVPAPGPLLRPLPVLPGGLRRLPRGAVRLPRGVLPALEALQRGQPRLQALRVGAQLLR